MYCLSQISLIASLDILCSNPLNLKNEITKIEHKKIFCGPSNFGKYLMTHQYVPKIFHATPPPQNPSGRPPTY